MSVALAIVLLPLCGCTSRGLTVTTDPPGAEVSINRRVVGITPIRVGFTHYGTYRIEIRKERFLTLVKEEKISPPIYGYDPIALVADNVLPARLNDEVYLHYVIKPLEDKSDRAELMDRALGAVTGLVVNPRTGTQVQVAYSRPVLPTAVKGEEDPLLADKNVPAPPPPSDLGPVKEIAAPQPEGPRLGKELGIESTDKRATFIKPEDAKKPATPRVIRTPLDEELIYEKPPAAPAPKEEPGAGKPAPAAPPPRAPAVSKDQPRVTK